mmetsp:Transcript_44830/g.116060  ORF Transcript_44830/g.116060 Transcript_44830/m.116060 type:complete len:330 (-) Transcript_44830:466-1455(-)
MVVDIVAHAIAEDEEQIAFVDLKSVGVAVRGIVLVELGEFPHERWWQPGELIRAIPAMLLLVGFERDGHPARSFSQQHEAGVAKISDTDSVAIKAQHDHGGGAVRFRSMLPSIARCHCALFNWAIKDILARLATRSQRFLCTLHEISGIISSIHTVARKLHHAANTISDAQGIVRCEVCILGSSIAVLLAELVGSMLEHHIPLARRWRHLRKREAVEAQSQLCIEEARKDGLGEGVATMGRRPLSMSSTKIDIILIGVVTEVTRQRSKIVANAEGPSTTHTLRWRHHLALVVDGVRVHRSLPRLSRKDVSPHRVIEESRVGVAVRRVIS